MSGAPLADPGAVAARQNGRSRGTTALLAAMAILILLQRVHTFAEPPERDIAGYAVIGHEMLRGRELYTDLWERKPPLLYLTFAAAERLVGYGPREIFVINVTVALLTLAGCFAAGTAGGGVTAGLIAAGLWTLLGGDPFMEANQPNGEVFVNAALTAAVAVMIRPSRLVSRTGLAIGLLFAISSMYEQHVIITCCTLSAAYLVTGGSEEFRRRLAALTMAASIGAISWSVLVGYFAAVGRLNAAMDVLFNQLFTQFSLRQNLAAALLPENLYPWFMAWVAGPVVLILLALASNAAGRSPRRDTVFQTVPAMLEPRKARFATVGNHPLGPQDRVTAKFSSNSIGRPWSIWTGWAVGTWFVIALPGWFFPHYYQLWIPPMCIAGGWAASRLLGPNRWPRAVGWSAVVGVLAVLTARQLPPYRWSANQWSNRKYEFDTFVEQAYLAHRLTTLLQPDERFWVLGQDNTIYFLANRSPVTGLLFLHPVLDPKNDSYWPRLMADLRRNRPELVIVRFPWESWLPPNNPVSPWLRDNYIPLTTNLTCPSYNFWVRKDDFDLQQRFMHPPPAAPFRRME